MAYVVELVSSVRAIVPETNTIGEIEVKVLSVGNGTSTSSSQLFTYTQPPQETQIGSGTVGQLFVTDPIIKTPL